MMMTMHGMIVWTTALPNIISFIKNGITPVHICARYGHDELLEQLCDTYQADPSAASYVSLPIILNYGFHS